MIGSGIIGGEISFVSENGAIMKLGWLCCFSLGEGEGGDVGLVNWMVSYCEGREIAGIYSNELVYVFDDDPWSFLFAFPFFFGTAIAFIIFNTSFLFPYFFGRSFPIIGDIFILSETMFCYLVGTSKVWESLMLSSKLSLSTTRSGAGG